MCLYLTISPFLFPCWLAFSTMTCLFIHLSLFDSIRRAVSSGSVDCACAMLNHTSTLLESDYRDVLYGKLRAGFPSGSFDVSQAYSMLQQGRLPTSASDTNAAKLEFLVRKREMYNFWFEVNLIHVNSCTLHSKAKYYTNTRFILLTTKLFVPLVNLIFFFFFLNSRMKGGQVE